MCIERLVGVGKDLRPPSLAEDLDAVCEVELAVAQAFRQQPHHDALQRPRARELPVNERRRRQLGDELRERPPHGREQLEQLAEARGRVVGGQELREDVPAADRAGEDDAVLGSRLRQVAERRGRAHDLEPAPFQRALDLARDGDRERELPAPAVASDQAQEEQQRLLDRYLAAALVDEIEALGRTVEDHAEVGADRGDELLHLPDRLSQQRGAGIGPVRREPVRGDRLDSERPEQQRQHERRRREAVVDDEAEAARADRLDVEAVEQDPARTTRARAPDS